MRPKNYCCVGATLVRLNKKKRKDSKTKSKKSRYFSAMKNETMINKLHLNIQIINTDEGKKTEASNNLEFLHIGWFVYCNNSSCWNININYYFSVWKEFFIFSSLPLADISDYQWKWKDCLKNWDRSSEVTHIFPPNRVELRMLLWWTPYTFPDYESE